jgi:phosphatidylcholine synthase
MALHAYTASGSVLALLIVIVAMDGDTIGALWLLLAALVIDGTDGMLARRLRVSEALPWFDGARLDDIVDYLTYAFAPMVLLWAGWLPPFRVAGAGTRGPARDGLELPVLPGRRQDR